LSHTDFKIFGDIFNGKYSDFNIGWYSRISGIFFNTILIIGLGPVMDVIWWSARSRILMYQDTGRFTTPAEGETVVSRAKTVQMFMNTYTGPELMIHSRFSMFMVSIFTAMVYGVGSPILFPIVTCTLCF
jgi:hypothetical protein